VEYDKARNGRMEKLGIGENSETLIKGFLEACRAAGLKVTQQRIEIYRELLQSSDHPAAELLHKRLAERMPTISLDTVYRTLATLEQHGLVSRVQTVGSLARFEAVTIPHHHLICSKCNQVADFNWSAFESVELPALAEQWGRILSKNVVMYGICSRCLSNT
jgi:Fur family transcriptional regulator, peroxide stress response regulator